LSCVAVRDVAGAPEALAYRIGIDCAVDRLLLAGKTDAAARIASWRPPRLPIGGGVLIARGLPEGPVVARTLRKIEQRWVDAGFPQGDAFEAIVADALAAARG
jgi:poly(A) polymerase